MYRLATELLQPFLLFYLATVLGVANLWRRRREGRRRLLPCTLPDVALMIWCTPAVSYLALGTLDGVIHRSDNARPMRRRSWSLAEASSPPMPDAIGRSSV